MGLCEYGRGEKKAEYHDYDKKQHTNHECPRDARPNRNYCDFHDKEYADENTDVVMKLFYKLVDEAVQKAIPLFCIGFYLPKEVDLANKEFKDNVYFSYATFNKEVDFSRATFTERVNFFYTIFTKKADFLEATFTKAHFVNLYKSVKTAGMGVSGQKVMFLKLKNINRTLYIHTNYVHLCKT